MASYIVLKVKNLITPNSHICSIDGWDFELFQKFQKFCKLNSLGFPLQHVYVHLKVSEMIFLEIQYFS